MTLVSICNQIPCQIMDIITTIIRFIKIGVPVLLIIFGMLDLGKAVIANKAEDIKKNQQMFIKRLVSVVLMYLVIVFVELGLSIVSMGDNTAKECIDTIVKPKHKDGECTV